MIDIKLLTIKDLLPVKEVGFAQGVFPTSVVVVGQRFDEASSVQINDIECKEFVVISPSKIIAQVPESQLTSSLNKIAVIANIPSINRKSLLSFEVGSSVKSITGLEKLVQLFCKLLLQSPGSDKFRPEEGAGLLKLIGRNVSSGDTKNLQASVVGAVSRARDQVLTIQGSNRKIPPDEKLLNATADAIGFDVQTTTLTSRISLSAVSGRQAVANLTL